MRQPDTSALRERLANYTPGQELNEDKQEGSVVILGGLIFVNFPLCIHLC